jgi:hypothetical protein
MNESSPAASALGQVSADVNVSLPLGLANRELIRLAKELRALAGPVASWTVEGVSRSCERTESIETIEGVLERTDETVWSLPPQ